MRLLHPIRLGVLLAVLAVVTLGVVVLTKSTQATPVADEYSMEINVAAAADAVGGATFVVQVGIVHGGVTDPASCIDSATSLPFAEPPFGCYAGAQWHVDYDQTLVDLLPLGSVGTAGIVKVAVAPSQCNLKNDDGARVLAACFNLAPPPNTILAYSGPVWNLTFDCIADGFADFTLVTTGSAITLVIDDNFDLPIHVHNDSIECGNGGPTRTPTLTNTAVPATATNTPTPGCFGDLNGDGKVSGRDVAIVARALGRQTNPDADLNHDGKVSVLDLVLVTKAMDSDAC